MIIQSTDNKIHNHSASVFESTLLQQVMAKMSGLIVGLLSAADKKQIIESYATCKQTARLLQEFRKANEEYGVPYSIYTPELMLAHEKVLEDIAREYRKLLCRVL